MEGLWSPDASHLSGTKMAKTGGISVPFGLRARSSGVQQNIPSPPLEASEFEVRDSYLLGLRALLGVIGVISEDGFLSRQRISA